MTRKTLKPQHYPMPPRQAPTSPLDIHREVSEEGIGAFAFAAALALALLALLILKVAL